MSKKLRSAEKICLFQGNRNLHVNRIISEWREETDNSYAEGSIREQANVREEGAIVKQLWDSGAVLETLHLLPYLHTECGPKDATQQVPLVQPAGVKDQFFCL